MKIKGKFKTINSPLSVIDAENGGVSVSAVECEKKMSILRYGQYRQVGEAGHGETKKGIIKATTKK